MCTQFTPASAEHIASAFNTRPPREDYGTLAFPGNLAPILRPAALHALQCDLAVFGLIPHWSRDGRNYRHCYNARSETAAEKPSFRRAWAQRQWCAIPAEAFYEPCYETGRSVRWRIGSAQPTPLLIAGLWDQWCAPDGRSVLSFTMLTRNADDHPVMRRFHPAEDEKRSVILLAPDALEDWFGATSRTAHDQMHAFEPERVLATPSPSPAR
jgi:putative SOS response-associated peptidase YedK